VLPHVGNHHAVVGQAAEEFIEKTNGRLRQSPRIKLGSFRTTGNIAPRAEVGKGRSLVPHVRMKRGNGICQVSDHGLITGADAVELRRIDFKMNDPGLRRKARRIARDAVV